MTRILIHNEKRIEKDVGPCKANGMWQDPVVVLDTVDILVLLKPPGWEVYDRNAERQLADFLVNLQHGWA